MVRSLRRNSLTSPQALTPQALRLLSREMVTLRSEPPEGVRIVVDEDDISAIEGWVQGPGE
jgi:ubiquitin-conjugating enzyme E2 S